MKRGDEQRFASAIATLGEAWRQMITKQTILAYELGLNDLPIEAIEAAVAKALRTCRFMPTPVELRELAGEVPAAARAVLAWEAFATAVLRIGGYRSVLFDDPILMATVRNLGGWQYCCERPPEEFDKWLRKDFLQTYQALAAAGVDGDACSFLPGAYAQENARLGHSHAASEAVVEIRTGYMQPQRSVIATRRRDPLRLTDNVGRMPK